MPIPSAIASRGDPIFASSPRTRIRPPSAGYMPYSTRINVDLPAPFSPISAWTSPARSSRSTSSLASTPGNRFVMRSSTTRGGEPLLPAPIAGASRFAVRPALGASGVSGTTMVPSMICCLNWSSCSVMSAVSSVGFEVA